MQTKQADRTWSAVVFGDGDIDNLANMVKSHLVPLSSIVQGMKRDQISYDTPGHRIAFNYGIPVLHEFEKACVGILLYLAAKPYVLDAAQALSDLF